MSKAKLLRALADDLHRVADDVSAVADLFAEASDNQTPSTPAEEAPKPRVKDENSPELIKLRATLRSLLEKGGDAYGMICRYGASNLTEVDPVHYAAMQAEAEALLNGSN